MRAMRYHECGGPEVLQEEEVDRPTPGRGEVLIEVRATSVNPIDAMIRGGHLGCDVPAVPGSDLAGIVAATGDEVEEFEEGDRVFGAGYGGDGRGTAAEFALYPADWVAALPESVSFVEGTAMALVGGTAWRALLDHGDLGPADACLIHGGSGGVGHVAVQLARIVGADVVATAGSAAHRNRVTELGADTAVDYARDDLDEALSDALPTGADVILDHRLDDYFPLDVELAAHNATIVTIYGGIPAVSDPAIRGKELTLQCMGGANKPDRQGNLQRLAHLLDSGELTAIVDRTYELNELPEAHRAVLEDSFIGKLVVTP